MSTKRTWAMLSAVGTGNEPDGLCGNKADHPAHLHDSASLGRFWCTADQADREPGRSQRRRDMAAEQAQRPTVHYGGPGPNVVAGQPHRPAGSC